jgi:hypothetical protein
MQDFLLVNRVEVLAQGGCSACGGGFSSEPVGEKTLVLGIGNPDRVYFFCSPCADNIMSHIQSEDTRKRYNWDWAVPLRGPGRNSQPH